MENCDQLWLQQICTGKSQWWLFSCIVLLNGFRCITTNLQQILWGKLTSKSLNNISCIPISDWIWTKGKLNFPTEIIYGIEGARKTLNKLNVAHRMCAVSVQQVHPSHSYGHYLLKRFLIWPSYFRMDVCLPSKSKREWQSLECLLFLQRIDFVPAKNNTYVMAIRHE